MRGEMGFQTSYTADTNEVKAQYLRCFETKTVTRLEPQWGSWSRIIKKCHIFSTDWKWTILTAFRVSCSGIISHFIVHLNVQQVWMRHKCGAIMPSVESDKMVNPVWPCEDMSLFPFLSVIHFTQVITASVSVLRLITLHHDSLSSAKYMQLLPCSGGKWKSTNSRRFFRYLHCTWVGVFFFLSDDF